MNHPDVVCLNKKQLALVIENLNKNEVYVQNVKSLVKQSDFLEPTQVYVDEEPLEQRKNNTLSYKRFEKPIWGKAIFYYGAKHYEALPDQFKITDEEAATISNLK